jgi:hypothetical protein
MLYTPHYTYSDPDLLTEEPSWADETQEELMFTVSVRGLLVDVHYDMDGCFLTWNHGTTCYADLDNEEQNQIARAVCALTGAEYIED